MKKLFLMVFFAAIAVALSGCGHNMFSFFDGTDASLEPSLNNGFSAHLRYGQVVQVTMKEKAKAVIRIGKDIKTGDGITTGDQIEITFETGDQTNGYSVEMAKSAAGTNAD